MASFDPAKGGPERAERHALASTSIHEAREVEAIVEIVAIADPAGGNHLLECGREERDRIANGEDGLRLASRAPRMVAVRAARGAGQAEPGAVALDGRRRAVAVGQDE